MTSRWRQALLMLAALSAGQGVAQDHTATTPWLDVPASWQRSVENGVVAVAPADLPSQSSFLMLIEPATTTTETLHASYDRALVDLGPWTSVGDVQEVSFENGWIFRYGIGVTHLDGQTYTAETAVARYGNQLVRFWVLADSDDTFNRYKDAIGNAIASVQDSTAAATAVASAPSPAMLDAAFGSGDSGVYLGLERGLQADAGFGSGTQQSVGDYQELDILFPDGSYRRGLPTRGLAGDLAWDRANFPTWWGRWSRSGDTITTERGGYVGRYTTRGNELVSERGRPWVKLPRPVATRRIEGSYARHDYRDGSAPRLVLHADGRYEDRGDFLRMVGSAANLVVPDASNLVRQWSDDEARGAMAGGRGRYTVGDFTLTFNGDDGRVWKFGFYTPTSSGAVAPDEFTLNTYRLLRD